MCLAVPYKKGWPKPYIYAVYSMKSLYENRTFDRIYTVSANPTYKLYGKVIYRVYIRYA